MASFGVAPSAGFVSDPSPPAFFTPSKAATGYVTGGLLRSPPGLGSPQAQLVRAALISEGQGRGQVTPSSLSLLGDVLFRPNSPLTNFSLM